MRAQLSLQTLFTLKLLLFSYYANAKGHDPHKAAGKVSNHDHDDFWFKYVSRPDIMAPRWDIWNYEKKSLAPGYWFIAPYQALDQTERGEPWVGPYMYDQEGELIWAGPPSFDHYKSFDLRVAQLNGEDFLTVIYPRENTGRILNNQYEVIKRVTYSKTWNTSNMHDFTVMKNGKEALVLTKDKDGNMTREQSAVVNFDGECGVRADGIKLLNIETDETKVIFEWHGKNHIGLDEVTFRPHSVDKMCNGHWDIHHFNAVDEFPDGDFLLSSRHTDTIYKISRETGEIVWRLGGVKSDFKLPRECTFTRQHHARVFSQKGKTTVITLFDNAKGTGANQHASWDHSRGLRISLDTEKMEGKLVAAYDHPRWAITNSRGSNQIVTNDNVFMCWAYHTLISEHAPDGRILMQARLRKNLHTYRAYKYQWVGHPTELPSVVSAAYVAGHRNTSTIVHVSWNGATEVAWWNVYEASRSGQKGKKIKDGIRTGFETRIEIENQYLEYVIVEAVDKRNYALGESALIQTIPPVETVDEFDDQGAGSSTDFQRPDMIEDTTQQSHPHHTSTHQGTSWTSELVSYMANPIATFVSGFIACAVVICVFWFAMRWKSKNVSWWQLKSKGYESLERSNQEADLEDEMERAQKY